jgi:FtsH-binding integral membrane protein
MMTQNSQFSKANIYSEQPPTRKIISKVILFVTLALISTAVWIHNLLVPSLTGNWLWICSLFTLGLIIGSGSLAFSNLKKWRLSTQNSQEQQETVSIPGTSQRSFSLLMWLCSILEVALAATLIVLQFNGNANVKELSQSLISGVAVSLFIWLAYRAYRYIDW